MANSHHSKAMYKRIAAKIRGQKRTEETRKRISTALMGHKFTPETLAKMRGRKRSLASRRRMSQAMKGKMAWNKGKPMSEEQKEYLRQINLGKRMSEEVKKKIRRSILKRFKALNPLYKSPTYENGEPRRTHEGIRRYRIKLNGGKHTKQQWEALKLAYNYTCGMCKRKEPEIKLTKDHIISIRNGGTSDISNIQPLCRSCNSKKK